MRFSSASMAAIFSLFRWYSAIRSSRTTWPAFSPMGVPAGGANGTCTDGAACTGCCVAESGAMEPSTGWFAVAFAPINGTFTCCPGFFMKFHSNAIL